MYTLTIEFEDLFGERKNETFFFHLNQDELANYISKRGSGYGNILIEIADRKNPLELYVSIRDIILLAYGERSADGVRFVKSKELTEAFEQHVAFDTVVEKILENPEAFITGILPANASLQVKAELEKRQA